MKNLTSHQRHEAIGQALAWVSRRLESGELYGSGRYYTDAELAAGAATRGKAASTSPEEASAA